MAKFSEKQLYDFVKDKGDAKVQITAGTLHYLNAYKKNPSLGFFLSWNWPAFFFGIIWMVYRRMYLYAGAIVILNAGFAKIWSYWAWLSMIILGAIGNSLYLNFAKRKVLKGKKGKGPNNHVITAIVFINLFYVAYAAYKLYQTYIPFTKTPIEAMATSLSVI